MIVTSIPRSGSTKYCIDLAEKLNFNFYDEIFELGALSKHKHKDVALHECKLDSEYHKDASYIKLIDFSKSVINNHEISFFMLENTDRFISRRNIQDSIWSLISHTEKIIRHYRPSHDDESVNRLLYAMFDKWLPRIHFFYDYCVVYEKHIVIPDLEFPDSLIYRNKYSRFTHVIDSFGEKIILPKGFIYE